jgi:hypothetical protein
MVERGWNPAQTLSVGRIEIQWFELVRAEDE